MWYTINNSNIEFSSGVKKTKYESDDIECNDI